MLSFWAAVVPILASLYAGGSFLIEAARLGHEVRVFRRIDAWYRAEHAALDGRVHASRLASELLARRNLLLECNGVDPTYGTYTRAEMLTGPLPMRPLELRRQWVLLGGAVVGVVLLGMDGV